MSAWLVSREHIRAMVGAALSRKFRNGSEFSYWHDGEHRKVNDLNQDEIGQMLWDENRASLAYRYPDGGMDDTEPPYKHLNGTDDPDPVLILKACDCYEYQCCEHPEWEASASWAFNNALRRAAWRKLPGYEEAPWGID